MGKLTSVEPIRRNQPSIEPSKRPSSGLRSLKPPPRLSVSTETAQRQNIFAKAFGAPAFTGGGEVHDVHEREADDVARRLPDASSGELSGRIRPARPGAGLQGVAPTIQRAISAASGQGSPLPKGLADDFGAKLGTDLSSVRVHTDSQADSLNKQLNARAFTAGRDVFFRGGQYSPSVSSGQSLLAHELTHVVQQCGENAPSQGASVQPMIQRFIMQIGAFDDYTKTMSRSLHKDYPRERFIQLSALWDDGGEFYAPTKKSLGNVVPDRKLSKLAKREPLRLVAHGNVSGKVGGYSAKDMAKMLMGIGLPKDHVGGIDVHACLPANKWRDDQGNQQEPHIVDLQNMLTGQGYEEVVRGYQHCIFPNSPHNEVPSTAYKLYTRVAMEASAARGDNEWKLSDEQLKIMKDTMGEDEYLEFLMSHTSDGRTPNYNNNLQFYYHLRDWMEQHNMYFGQARLRRAASVGMVLEKKQNVE